MEMAVKNAPNAEGEVTKTPIKILNIALNWDIQYQRLDTGEEMPPTLNERDQVNINLNDATAVQKTLKKDKTLLDFIPKLLEKVFANFDPSTTESDEFVAAISAAVDKAITK